MINEVFKRFVIKLIFRLYIFRFCYDRWTMATPHARLMANQMPGEQGVKARALQERLETIQNNQMQDAMDLIRNMDSYYKQHEV